MFAKMVLPTLGGAPAVWSVAMVFFQALLLAGYAYAHWLAGLPAGRALTVHLALMAVAALFLPIGLPEGWGRPPADGEALWLLGLFAVAVGPPFLALAANGPLLQAWFSRSGHAQARDPYFLYAASNVGSFAALLAYPLVAEPLLALRQQTAAWAGGFALLAVLIAWCGVRTARAGGGGAAAAARRPAGRTTWGERLAWTGLSFVPSGLLVAVTSHISTDVAAAPLLWVVPLALFLLTFVLAFRERPLVPPEALAARRPR
jgi:hypothetical protein